MFNYTFQSYNTRLINDGTTPSSSGHHQGIVQELHLPTMDGVCLHCLCMCAVWGWERLLALMEWVSWPSLIEDDGWYSLDNIQCLNCIFLDIQESPLRIFQFGCCCVIMFVWAQSHHAERGAHNYCIGVLITTPVSPSSQQWSALYPNINYCIV